MAIGALKGSRAVGAAPAGGISDFDADGIVDANDQCPADPAPGGCPPRPIALADADGDKVPDVADACPAIAAEGGCPTAPVIISPDPGPPTPTPWLR